LSLKNCSLAAAFVFLLAGSGQALRGDEPNPILKRLLTSGISAGGSAVKLPAPTLPDGLDAAAQRQAMGRIADRNHTLEALTRRSVVAPLVLKISAAGDSAAGSDEKSDGDNSDSAKPQAEKSSDGLARVDLWFVAYGQLETLHDESFWKSWSKSAAKEGGKVEVKGEVEAARSGVLSAEALQSRGIHDADDTRHLSADVTLFKEVRLSATLETMRSRTDDSLIVAGQLDPRFAGDKEYPNRWWRLDRDDSGHLTAGPPHDYRGAGWYVKATKLHEPEGSLLVEYHLVFEEPYGWFNGGNYLRSKLPVVVQDGVRRFRRRLSDEEKAAE